MKFNIYNQVDSDTFQKLKESARPTAGVFKNKMFFSESGVHVFGKITNVHAEFILNSGERLIEACKMKAKPVKEESKPAVTPTVVTTDYVSSHGKQPAGRGNWIFGLGSKKEDDWFQINDTFANAKKKAIEKAKKAGIAKVYVMESVAAESVELDVVVESVGARSVKARMLAEGREEVGFHVMTESAAMTKACQWLVEKVASIKVEEPKEADTVSTELIKNMIKKYREAVNKEQGIETEEDPLPDGDTEYMDAFVVKDAPKVKGLKTEAVDPKAKLEKQIASLEKKEAALRDRLGLARERRKASGKSKGVQGQAEMKIQSKLDALQTEIAKAKQEIKALTSAVSSSKEKTVQESTSALSTWKSKVKAKYPKASFEVQKKTDRYSSDRVEAQDGGKVVGYFEKKSGRSNIIEAFEGESDSFSDYDDWVAACREAGATVFKSSDPEDYEAGVRAYYLDGRKLVDVGYWADGEGQVTRYVEQESFDETEFAKHMEKLKAREQLRKTNPSKAAVSDMVDTSREKKLSDSGSTSSDDKWSTYSTYSVSPNSVHKTYESLADAAAKHLDSM